MSDKRILILVAANAAEDHGTTVRGKAVCDVLKHKYHTAMPLARSWYSASALVLVVGYVVWMLKLLYIVPRHRVDCVYCCADYFGFVSSYALSKVFGFQVVFEAHGILSEENKAKNRPTILIQACSSLERFVISRAEYVVALSRGILEFYKQFNANIDLIPVFVDEQVYRKSHTTVGNLKTIGLIGPFDMPANRYFLQFLRENIDDFDQRIRVKVIGKCDDTIANDRIMYTGYVSSRDGYVAELTSLDALLVPSKLSTSGPLTKILEAMACSLPVFTTPQGVVGLDYAENGVSIIVKDINKLVAAINQTIFNEALIESIGHNARSLIEKTYSRKINEIKLQRIMDNLMYGEVKRL